MDKPVPIRLARHQTELASPRSIHQHGRQPPGYRVKFSGPFHPLAGLSTPVTFVQHHIFFVRFRARVFHDRVDEAKIIDLADAVGSRGWRNLVYDPELAWCPRSCWFYSYYPRKDASSSKTRIAPRFKHLRQMQISACLALQAQTYDVNHIGTPSREISRARRHRSTISYQST